MAFKGLLWTLVILILAFGISRLGHRETVQMALNRAIDNYQKDMVYRQWASERGGVYVPLDALTPANTHLKGLPDREIQGSNGRTYTLVNPAYMTRMVHEIGFQRFGIYGHITSLKPLREENVPDAWERKALQRFEQGADQVWEETEEDGTWLLRYMAPFRVDATCLKCHAGQGYAVGDIRGGISVKVPIESGAFHILGGRRAWIFGLYGLLLSVWVAGLAVLGLFHQRERLFAQTRRETVEEHRILQQRFEQFQRLESIGRLASGVSHDINNVLGAILATTEVLRSRHGDPEEVERRADLILGAATRGRDLVLKLNEFARRGVQDPTPLDLNALVHREAEILEHTTFHRIKVLLDLHVPLPAVVGDGSAISNALMNLCINACDAMPSGGELRISTRVPEEGWVELLVADTGEGMPPAVLERAMEPFFTTKPMGKGTGLGLSVVYGTLRAHRGTVDIQSAPGQGTTVILRFPAAGDLQPLTVPASPATPNTPARRTLVVDDDELVNLCVSELFACIGFPVESVPGGAEALARLEAHPPLDLVLLDSNMPGMSGMECLARIRERHPHLPVIFSSGHLEARELSRLEAFRKVWVLGKPFTLDELRHVLARMEPPPDKGH
nr:ATP-binding protein [uncultured Holophaga sp.]